MKKLLKKIEEYNKKIHSKSGIGELYERQIRYLYEKMTLLEIYIVYEILALAYKLLVD